MVSTRTMAGTTSLSDLHDRLDSLWTSYLQFLDTYTASQKLLQKHMSAGYLSLARANFNARPGVRRYGQDYYHDRAIASRRTRVSIDDHEATSVEIVNCSGHTGGASNTDEKALSQSQGQSADIKQQPSPPATPKPVEEKTEDDGSSTLPNLTKQDDMKAEEHHTDPKSRLESDPMRWFGILVPQELRAAQSSFSSAVDETIADAVNAAKRLREFEVEIRKVRKEIRKAEKAEG